MASKRSAGSDLNHDNWDQEDTPEEAGTFNKASDDVLKKRVFKTAKRRIAKSSEEGSLNVFNPANLALLTSKSSKSASELFGHLSNVKSDLKTNGIGEKSEKQGNEDQVKTTSSFSFGSKPDKLEMKNSWPLFSNGKNGTEKNESKTIGPMFNFGSMNTKVENKCEVTDIIPSFSFVGHNNDKLESNKSSNIIFETKKSEDVDNEKITNNLGNYYSKLKGLNQSVAKWINKHVESNPLINLQPIFRDYETFFDEIEQERKKCDVSPPITSESKPQFDKVLKEADEKPVSSSSFISKPENQTLLQSAATFKFGVVSSADHVSSSESTPKFSFGNTNTTSTGFGSFSFNTSAPINFGSVAATTPVSNEENKNEEESDEPPKIDIKQVEEEGHIYTIRCKLFVKKDGNFIEKGIGSLFLKPVPNSDKVQLIVRAHNSLGNVLCNFILSKSIPTQRMGKNNVMVVCIPTPESQPQPVPVLIKVKTGEDADQLLETLEKHKK